MRTWPALDVSGIASPRPDPDASTADLMLASLADHPVAAIEEVSPDRWRVFFASTSDRRAAHTAIADTLPHLGITLADVPDDDWAARSQASLQAIQAGAIVVAPPWDTRPVDSALRIVIQPSMGFGTGHHATTRLCLRALQAVPLTGARVLDVGAGSGVLAIAASLLGAADVTGIDDDPDAVQAARENLVLNPQASVEFRVADLRAFHEGPFDVVTANLTGGLLAAAAEHLQTLSRSGGTLILSGMLRREVDEVVPRFGSCAVVGRSEEDEWAAVTLVRRSAP